LRRELWLSTSWLSTERKLCGFMLLSLLTEAGKFDFSFDGEQPLPSPPLRAGEGEKLRFDATRHSEAKKKRRHWAGAFH
jgi:hypothetical protein